MASELARRVGFAAVAIPLVLLVVWYGALPLAALAAVAAALSSSVWPSAAVSGRRARWGSPPRRRSRW